MARKKTRKKSKKNAAPKLSPEAQRDISAVVFAALAVLLMFASINFGGSLVTLLFHWLRVAMGYTAFGLWLVFAALAFMLFQPLKFEVRGNKYFGIMGILIGISALLHITIDPDFSMIRAQAGSGGGLIGHGIDSILLHFLNVIASSIVLVAFVLVCMVVVSDKQIIRMVLSLISPFSFKRELSEAPALPNDLQVNDNSGSNTLPFKGELAVGNVKRPLKPAPEEEKEALTISTDDKWVFPSLDLLSNASTKADPGNVKKNAATIQQTMESFGINVAMGEVNVGPTVTQYTFTPPNGVKLNKITGLDTNLALSLAAHPIRIEAPIPGKSAVGVEVPNKAIAKVRLRDVLTSPEIEAKKAPLTFVLGRDVSGIPMAADLATMPHMLIAGATGSGKSVMINALLTSLLYRNSPSDLKMILVDPKRVELGPYNGIPHLLTPVIVEPEKCISALKWAVAEMELRYKLLAEVGNRNIEEYNKAHKSDAMPYIVIVIDELADLMVIAAADVETLIVRLAQMARAIGIHLVLATQRPSVDVITGIIKANIPARLAFSVTSQIDSRTILDQMGAEKLLGKGDMLFSSPEYMKPRRIQGVLIDEAEVKAVTEYLRSVREPDYNEAVLSQKVNVGGRGSGGGSDSGEIEDELYMQAAEAVIRADKASTSMLQRRLRIGYSRAARLIDLLEEQGVVGPADGARPRDVLMSLEQVTSGRGGTEGMRMADPYDDID